MKDYCGMNMVAIQHNIDMLTQTLEDAKEHLRNANAYKFESDALTMRRLVRTIGEEAIEWADRIEQSNRIVREKVDGIIGER